VLLVTHDREFLDRIAVTKQVHLSNGRIQEIDVSPA